MKMMRYASPCWASVGATKNPRYRPTPHATSASTPKPSASFPARGKKVWGEEYLNQLMLISLFNRNTQCHRRGPRSERPGEYQQGAEEEKLGVSAHARGRRLGGARPDDQHRDIQGQHQQR